VNAVWFVARTEMRHRWLGVLVLVVGRVAWSRIAGRAGFDVVSVLPWHVAADVLGALVAVNAVAWFPARRAARLQPATVLRSE